MVKFSKESRPKRSRLVGWGVEFALLRFFADSTQLGIAAARSYTERCLAGREGLGRPEASRGALRGWGASARREPPHMLFSVLGLLAPSLLAASFASPLDWSGDGQWLAYTIEKRDAVALSPGWLFRRQLVANPRVGPALGDRSTHQIWVTRADGAESALIEESNAALSAPTWGPDGRSLFYGRFVPDGAESKTRGRYEIVARTGLDESRTIPLQLDAELDAERLASIALASPAISSDGRYLAVPKPGKAAGIWVVRLEQDRVVQSFDSARWPAWSPDGRRLSFVIEEPGTSGEPSRSVAIWNRDRGAERRLNMDVTLLDVPPVWSLDGQSLLAVAAPTGGGEGRPAQLDLVRVNLETGFGVRAMTLETFAPADLLRPNANRRSPLLSRFAGLNRIRVELSLDRERDQALCLIDAGVGEQALKWCNTRTQNTFKRFHPLDVTIGIGATTLAPDGQSVAFRVEGGDGRGLPAVCNLSTEAVTLIAPDGPTRARWLGELALRAIGLIEQGAQIRGDADSAARPTVLPPPNEFAADPPRLFRLKRLAKIAGGLIEPFPGPDALPTREVAGLEEHALFFEYLRGDYEAAESRLNRLESEAKSAQDRLRWSLLRAQILMGRGEFDRARGIVDYVDRSTATERREVEETPLGPVFSEVASPEQGWASLLGQKLSEIARLRSEGGLGNADGTGPLEPSPGEWGEGGGLGPTPIDAPHAPFVPDEGNPDPFDPDQPDAPIAPLPRARRGLIPAEIEQADPPGFTVPRRIIPLND